MTELREATTTDVEAIAGFAEYAFRDAFASSNSMEDMDLYCRKSFGKDIQQSEIEHPHTSTLLYLENEKIAGYAYLRVDTHLNCIDAASSMEIQRLYVHSQWHGRGVAQALMVACIEQAESAGAGVLWLCVWEENPRAIAFYRKHGFHTVGGNTFMFGTDLQQDLVMLRPIGPGGESATTSPV
ncbi:GNAT family N-acetyltransferase [Halioglobus sp. HI00S01]|uniref:GNAT family N-acetyltransferase n=1 Tax=Halioglobus sp. HI00S01 TaxID=1822214 RepID=UPI00082559CA|nr:GNAT family N-acetyltransferase [Halioglobus sp. HI00S01]